MILSPREQQERTSLATQGLKRCSKCKQIKSLDSFCNRKTATDGLRSNCKACDKVSHDKYRSDPENQKREQLYSHEWKKRHRDRVHEYNLEWNSRNGPLKTKLRRRWHLAHKEEENALSRERMRQWVAENLERHRDNNHKREAREAGSEGEYTSDQWQTMLSFFNGICPGCNKERKLTRDHVIPVAWGGSTYISNLQPLCKKCNSEKGDHYAVDYRPAYVRYWAYLESGGRL